MIAKRVASNDWTALAAELDAYGCALTGQLLTPKQCRDLAGLYDQDLFRTTVNMARHRFGSGEYRYFDDPPPSTVAELREAFYPHLLEIARDWWTRLGRDTPWPDDLDTWLKLCHEAGQEKSAQILLKYGEGDWNALHRDVFGEMLFPLQVVVGLDEPGADYTGGEFLLVEQRPRAQSRGDVVPLDQGEAVIFATRHRPVPGARGTYRTNLRHGVSRITAGRRFSLGIIFHDAA